LHISDLNCTLTGFNQSFHKLNLTIMKTICCFFAFIFFLSACQNSGKSTVASPSSDSVTMPYTAYYSSSFAISENKKNAQSVLQSYKDWEDNKLSNGTAYFADTVMMIFSDGSSFKLSRDSMIHVFQKFRDSLSSTKIEVAAVTNLHSIDKNADWVGVWYKQTDTYKSGKVDSAFYQDDNNLVNGKIVYISSKKQGLKK